MTIPTRRQCHGPCRSWFTPRTAVQITCDDCMGKAIDKAIGEVRQDNEEAGPWLRPADAMTLAQLRIANAQLVKDLARWKAFALSNYNGICAIAAPRQILGNQKKIAESQLKICEDDFPDLLNEAFGEAYRRRG